MFFKINFLPASEREEVTFYEFYVILNEVVKMYMPCYTNVNLTLKKS